jgi:hypothetical protein
VISQLQHEQGLSVGLGLGLGLGLVWLGLKSRQLIRKGLGNVTGRQKRGNRRAGFASGSEKTIEVTSRKNRIERFSGLDSMICCNKLERGADFGLPITCRMISLRHSRSLSAHSVTLIYLTVISVWC